ncbi:WD repeat-containing protein 44 [Senna tora]|uniref:WD repeat-containing protein 44 n=1 Tax=Senna tora TaxID=362788 RepID=A0A834U491_9FABA|nr:WD repeat-containing protein 44 [Senna tora]
MGSFISDDDEECRFFDASEDVLSIADAKSDGGTDTTPVMGLAWNYSEYEVWIRSPRSVRERRSKFMKWMELSSDRIALENSIETSGAVRRISALEDEFCSSRSSMSCWSTENCSEEFGLVWDKKIGDGSTSTDMGSDHLVGSEKKPEDSEKASVESPPTFQRLMGKEFEDTNVFACKVKRARRGWFRRLRSITCMIDGQVQGDRGRRQEGTCGLSGCRIQRVKVRQFRKGMKELSALFMGQDFQAHEGSILTMKFSPDGQYLASAGEDGVVRLWKVVEDERCNEIDTPELDPSCVYFTVNNVSELTPLFMDKEKMSKGRSLRKTSDSACIILPPKVFRLLERPLHEFHGHEGEILDLSWSNNNYLLSSSVDKTVRLWRVGYDHCLKVFSHNNYVTCIQFNPVDDNHFISGSIDGKVRIWAIPDCHVVDWTDVREIVTAVCYRPDGQGGIIGSLTGNCRFYNVSENHLQLDSQLCLLNKKKLPGRGITGFQFLPHDSSKVMVTCSDSQVRILDGLNVVGKYKGLSAGNHMSASFTSDGKHILSACEDSNVYLWNVSQERSNPTKPKKIRSSERFFSNASVAVPWCGLKSQNTENERRQNVSYQRSSQLVHLGPPASFSLGQEFFSESPKGSATWPEEKLHSSSPKAGKSSMHKSAYKFLKASCKSTSSTHAWGLVIVTAGWDGRIKSFYNYGLPVTV